MTIELRRTGVRGAGRSRRALTAIAMLAAAALACSALPAKARAGIGAGAPSVAEGRTPPESSDWEPADSADTSASDANSGQVLELPQAVDPEQAQAPDANDAAAQAGNGAAQEPDQVGNLDDYQSTMDSEPMPVYLVPVVPRGWVAGRPLAVNPAMPRTGGMRGMGGMMPGSSIYVPPAGISPIMPTSPMLTTPPGSGALPGGWWTRAH